MNQISYILAAIMIIASIIFISVQCVRFDRRKAKRDERDKETESEETPEPTLYDEWDEDKKLLYADMCSRIPYGTKCSILFKERTEGGIDGYITDLDVFVIEEFEDMEAYDLKSIKPILRRFTDMTEDEHTELFNTYHNVEMEECEKSGDYPKASCLGDMAKYDWLNAHHFDYRGLIDKGLAEPVTEKHNPYI